MTVRPEPGAKRGGTLRYAVHNAPAHFDVHQSGTVANIGPQSPMYDTLLRRSPKDGQTIIPDLAWKWEISPDNKKYTFHLRKGVKFHDGADFTAEDVKATYERIAHLGPKGFYRGAVADAMVNTVQQPVISPAANHVWRPGLMTMRDLHRYVAPERAPTHVNYRGLEVYSMGPPSSGGSTVGEALHILEGYPLSGMSRIDALHYFIEASR